MECKQTAANVQINCIPASPNAYVRVTRPLPERSGWVKGLARQTNVKNGIIHNVTTSIWSCMMPKTTVVAGVCNAF